MLEALPSGTALFIYLLSVHQPVHCLRSSSLDLLSKPGNNLYASQPAFNFASPSVWNDLSELVKSLEFNQYFKTWIEDYFRVMTSCTTSCRVSE